jgi:hypothetical protein
MLGARPINRSGGVRQQTCDLSSARCRFRFSPYQQGCAQGTGEGESGGNPQHQAIASDKSFVDRLAHERVVRFGCGKPGTLPFDVSPLRGRNAEIAHLPIQCGLENTGEKRPERRYG